MEGLSLPWAMKTLTSFLQSNSHPQSQTPSLRAARQGACFEETAAIGRSLATESLQAVTGVRLSDKRKKKTTVVQTVPGRKENNNEKHF